MSSQLNYAVFDWKDIDGLVEFLAIVTEHGPFCFRQVDTMTIVLWSSMDRNQLARRRLMSSIVSHKAT